MVAEIVIAVAGGFIIFAMGTRVGFDLGRVYERMEKEKNNAQ